MSPPDSHYVREAAIALCAVGCLLGHDASRAENAVSHARVLFEEYEYAEHDGDCTNRPMTCLRCLVDEHKAQAKREHG